MAAKKAKPKTVGIARIKAYAKMVGMTVSDFMEWGSHTVLQTYNVENGSIEDARAGLELARELEGEIDPGIIAASPVERFAEEAGLSTAEFLELALLSAINILNTSVFPGKQPKEELEDYRKECGPLNMLKSFMRAVNAA
ncbi:MAG: hypothetical protein K9M45_12870 [Kiritimatiellales bacterium]|nr:hypothetical protein [Kiritimatiellales bacterium]